VKELEAMADTVARETQELLCDLPKGLTIILELGSSNEERKAEDEVTTVTRGAGRIGS
jgi:hypothetical protein